MRKRSPSYFRRNETRERNHARVPRSSFRPVRVRAWLEAPVISDGTLPLDAVLYFIRHREVCEPMACTIPGASARESHSGASLPLARCEEHGPLWYYACSFAQWPEIVAEGQDHWNKRVDESLCYLVDFQGRRGKIDIASSTYKSYHMPVFYRHSLYVDWYALGDAAEIRRLLCFATHLGKKTAHGWGAVSRWEVEEIADDWSVKGPSGQLMRAVPSKDRAGIFVGYRPSYWLPKNQAPCLMPTGAR